MGEANRRGTFEERVAQSKQRHDKEYRDAQAEHERRTKIMAEQRLAGVRRTSGRGGLGMLLAAAAIVGAPLRGNPLAGGIIHE